MRNMTHKQARAVVKDLVEDRGQLIEELPLGPEAMAMLRAHLQEIEAVPEEAPETTPVKPLVDEQATQGRALGSLLEAHGRPPLASPEQEAAAGRLRANILDAQRAVGTSAADRGVFIESLDVEALQPDLALFAETPIPQVAAAWIAAGQQLAQVTANNATASRGEDSRTLEQLTKVRRTLKHVRDLIRVDQFFTPDRPRNLELLILGYLDSLNESRGRASAEVEDETEALESVPPQPAAFADVSEG